MYSTAVLAPSGFTFSGSARIGAEVNVTLDSGVDTLPSKRLGFVYTTLSSFTDDFTIGLTASASALSAALSP